MVAAAALQDWSATDLIWSLWISSLVVGYAFIVVTTFLGNGLFGSGARSEGPGAPREPGPDGSRAAAGGTGTAGASRAVGLVLALFTLGFFTVHFGMFHFVHSVFLNQFFPLVEGTAGLFGEGGPVWWFVLVGTAVERYWPFLLATALSRREAFRRSVAADPDRDETLFQPYRNVVRMHLLIFVYVGLEAAGMSGWFLYAVLFFYFFPLGTLKELVAGGGGAPVG